MGAKRVKEQLESQGLGGRILHTQDSIETVAMAAQALGTQECRIAKTMAFDVRGETVLVCMAGDRKIDNPKFKAVFQTKARMIPFIETQVRTGHAPGGVCPFALKQGVKVYLDVSLKRFETVFPGAGDLYTAVELAADEMEMHTNSLGWVDVCKASQ
ncbi:MAG: YbaK/EbsC family protein [Clostridiales bacterium]|jgi:prolyl-tRNA editing enzyme YbaK/EbsC (Cys-tRNA(Pro) deacylase)|nr:YbaK/EbsC family protein [Eubacteriales bacterium]NLO16330.1 YbaK/EbsC family protein [Clostridiales bacterium]